MISENAPDAIKTGEIKNHFGRKVAIVCLTPRFLTTNSHQPEANQASFLTYTGRVCPLRTSPLRREY